MLLLLVGWGVRRGGGGLTAPCRGRVEEDEYVCEEGGRCLGGRGGDV